MIEIEDRTVTNELYVVLPENKPEEWDGLLAHERRIIFKNKKDAEALAIKMRLDLNGLMKLTKYRGAVVHTLTPEHKFWGEFIKEAI